MGKLNFIKPLLNIGYQIFIQWYAIGNTDNTFPMDDLKIL
jgi:hypothetical protein